MRFFACAQESPLWPPYRDQNLSRPFKMHPNREPFLDVSWISDGYLWVPVAPTYNLTMISSRSDAVDAAHTEFLFVFLEYNT